MAELLGFCPFRCSPARNALQNNFWRRANGRSAWRTAQIQASSAVEQFTTDFDFGHSSKSIFRVTELGFLLASNIQINDPAIRFSQGAKYKLMGTATIQLRIAQHQIDDHLCLMIVGRSWALMQTVKVSELQEGGAATNCASSKDSFGGCTWRQPCQCPRFIKPTCLSVTAYANNLITKNYISKHLCRMQEELVSVSRRIEESWISPGDGSL